MKTRNSKTRNQKPETRSVPSSFWFLVSDFRFCEYREASFSVSGFWFLVSSFLSGFWFLVSGFRFWFL